MTEQLDFQEKILQTFLGVKKHFSSVRDYRRQGSIKHNLIHIIFFTLCAVVAGSNDLVGVANWTKANETWLTDLFELKHGVPSLSTFRLTFMLLKPDSLSQCFSEWMKSLIGQSKLKAIAIDGKAQRGTALRKNPHSFIHIVSAWASEFGVTLGQLKVDGKSNEITAIPELIDLIDVKDAVVTLDAMGTQREIAEKIIAQGGDYILALKGNHSTLKTEIENYFAQLLEFGEKDIDFKSFEFDEENKRGRVETRKVHVATKWDFSKDYRSQWKKLRSIVCVESSRIESDKSYSSERRYYISSLTADPKDIGTLIRGHWGIESAHWILDVAFREDAQKSRTGHIAENLSLIRRMSLNYLKNEKTAKVGIANKRLKAAYDREYLIKVLRVNFF